MNELTRKCLSLPRNERARLARMLNESLKEKDMTDEGGRFKILYEAATDICGQGIISDCRDFSLVVGRRMIAYQMRKEGFSLQTIGKYLIRHHASVIHMIRMMKDAINFGFKPEMNYWEEFIKRIGDNETDKRPDQES